MSYSQQFRANRLICTTLALVLAFVATPPSPSARAAAEGILVQQADDRILLASPFLYLEFDLVRPAFDVIRVAPEGDGFYGESLGALVDEAADNQRGWRSSTDDADGAEASWQYVTEGVRLRIDGIDAHNLITSTWTVTLSANDASLRIERQTTVRPGVESTGLALVSPSVLPDTDPTSLARILDGANYRPEIGPEALEREGGLVGLLAVDHPELSFSAQTDQPDRVEARQEGSNIVLGFLRRPPSPSNGLLQENVAIRFGWDNDLLVTKSDIAPAVERRLFAAGYYGNAVISPVLGPVLSASMRDYRGSVWSRDTDYAMQGYAYMLDDMSVFGNTLQRFLERVDKTGIAPEYILVDGAYGNRESWDSMANVVQATHTYVSKTGDLDFYRHNDGSVKRALNWVRALDTNNDGLPDRDIFPYGYTDTVENGPMHTYAIAKHYAAFLAVADLEEAVGRDGGAYRNYAATMKASFQRPLAAGGYWNPETGYPIAWKRANGLVISSFETFGVFEAIRVGLIADPAQLQAIATWVDAHREAFLNSNPYPERLMIGGYDLRTMKPEVPPDKIWIMDSNAPWITGISVPARVRLGRIKDARAMLDVYVASSYRSTPHAEFGAGPLGVFGPGETQDGGRLWDNWSWFSAIYGTHFGLTMTPSALEVAPAPLDPATGRHMFDVSYQGARVDLELLDESYRITLDAPKRVILKPLYGYRSMDVNGDRKLQPERAFVAQPGVTYTVQSFR